MPLYGYFYIEFDTELRLMEISYRDKVYISNEQQLRNMFVNFEYIIEQYAGVKRVYLLIDVNNLIIEPALSNTYAALAKSICEKFIYPQGVARYGYQITRLTVRQGYMDRIKEDPNLFGTYKEAREYLDRVISENHYHTRHEKISSK